jgi:hypothetical protein
MNWEPDPLYYVMWLALGLLGLYILAAIISGAPI